MCSWFDLRDSPNFWQVAELKAQEIKNSEMMVDELRELSSKAESKIMEVEAARRAEEVRDSV